MITSDELMQYCRAPAIDAGLIRSLERAAVEAVSEQAGKYFGVTGEIVDHRSWRAWPIELSAEPDGAVVLDFWNGSAWEVVATDRYSVQGAFIYGESTWIPNWPRPYRLRATYTGGYTPVTGDPDTWDAPEDIKQAVRALTEHWYSNRGAVVVGSINTEMKLAVDYLIRNHRRTVA